MKPVMGDYRRGHARTWVGTNASSQKTSPTAGHKRVRRHPAKVWKRRPVTRAGSDRPKRSGPAR
jgi:hypothetical protein